MCSSKQKLSSVSCIQGLNDVIAAWDMMRLMLPINKPRPKNQIEKMEQAKELSV
jgi:hypothetical protein